MSEEPSPCQRGSGKRRRWFDVGISETHLNAPRAPTLVQAEFSSVASTWLPFPCLHQRRVSVNPTDALFTSSSCVTSRSQR